MDPNETTAAGNTPTWLSPDTLTGACPGYWRIYLDWIAACQAVRDARARDQAEAQARADRLQGRLTGHIQQCGCRMGLGPWRPLDERDE
jgi:hypothetical protein